MAYREGDALGSTTSEHRLGLGGSLSWIAGGLTGLVFAPILGSFAFERHHVSLRLLIGAFGSAAIAVWAFREWWQLRAIALALHDGGLRYRSAGTSEISVRWGEIVGLEAHYVPGMNKKGTDDARNRVSLLVRTSTGLELKLPKELAAFAQAVDTIAARSERAVNRVLIGSLMDR